VAFAAGVVAGSHLWRPPLWWLAGSGVILGAAAYWLKRRPWAARVAAVAAVCLAGALSIELRAPETPNDDIAPFTDGQELAVVAHVTHEGNLRQAGADAVKQSVDMETEQLMFGGKSIVVRSGARISIYGKDDASGGTPVVYQYGERLQFVAKLHPPRNFRNPGAFDLRGYLAEKGMVALGSSKAEGVKRLPGFAGSRLEWWRARIRRSIVEKAHELWPPAQAALVDAMVIGEDAFLDRDTRANFQRSGTYHILVVSGMNVGILAF